MQAFEALRRERLEYAPDRLGRPAKMSCDLRRRPTRRRKQHHFDPLPEPPRGVFGTTGLAEPRLFVLTDLHPEHSEVYNICVRVLSLHFGAFAAVNSG